MTANEHGGGSPSGDGTSPDLTILQRPGDVPLDLWAKGMKAGLELLSPQLIGIDMPRAWIPSERHEGICRACGQVTAMTFEHIPPKSAGNSVRARGASMWGHLDRQTLRDSGASSRVRAHLARADTWRRIQASLLSMYSFFIRDPLLHQDIHADGHLLDQHRSHLRDLNETLNPGPASNYRPDAANHENLDCVADGLDSAAANIHRDHRLPRPRHRQAHRRPLACAARENQDLTRLYTTITMEPPLNVPDAGSQTRPPRLAIPERPGL